jgi:hypothetical protein
LIDSQSADTFDLYTLAGAASANSNDFNEGAPSGDVTIVYYKNTITHRTVSNSSIGVSAGNQSNVLVAGDVVSLYAANLDSGDDAQFNGVAFGVSREQD